MTKQLEWSAPHGRANSQAWQLLTGAHCCILKPERAGKATEIHWIPNYPITNLSQFDIRTLSHSFCIFFAFCVCWKQHCPFDLNSAVMHFRKPNFILSLFYFSTQLHIAGPFCKLCWTRRRSPYHWVASVTWNPRKQQRYTVMTWASKFTKMPFSSRYKLNTFNQVIRSKIFSVISQLKIQMEISSFKNVLKLPTSCVFCFHIFFANRQQFIQIILSSHWVYLSDWIFILAKLRLQVCLQNFCISLNHKVSQKVLVFSVTFDREDWTPSSIKQKFVNK